MDREMEKQITKIKGKEKQDKQAIKATTIINAIKQVAKKELTKQQQATFIVAWSSSIIKKIRNKFRYNFQEGM